jgi:hypothetical protein
MIANVDFASNPSTRALPIKTHSRLSRKFALPNNARLLLRQLASKYYHVDIPAAELEMKSNACPAFMKLVVKTILNLATKTVNSIAISVSSNL